MGSIEISKQMLHIAALLSVFSEHRNTCTSESFLKSEGIEMDSMYALCSFTPKKASRNSPKGLEVTIYIPIGNPLGLSR